MPKTRRSNWDLSPCLAGMNPYWTGETDCTTPRKAVPFRDRQPHTLHTSRKSLSQQLDCSGGRTPVSTTGNHLKNIQNTLRWESWNDAGSHAFRQNVPSSQALSGKMAPETPPVREDGAGDTSSLCLLPLFKTPHLLHGEQESRQSTVPAKPLFFSSFSLPLPRQVLQCV